MKIKFDCNGNNAPAYSCSKPGDNSGEYIRSDLVRTLVEQAYMAGQYSDGAGCDPSYSMAQNYADRIGV